MRAILSGLVFASALAAQPAAEKLQYVVILGRHGVRAPTAPVEDLLKYSSDPWPRFGVAPGELTAHGHRLMVLLGDWYRGWLQADGLLPSGCDAARFVHIRADVDHRTAESGRAFAEGFASGCALPVKTVAGEVDPLFHPASAGAVQGEGKLAVAAVSGRVGGDVGALSLAYAPAFATLHRILFGATQPPAKQDLLTLPASIAATEEGLADIRGPIRTGSTLAENLLLEYADGMTGKDLGWGRLDAKNLNEVMAIHTAYADLARRTPYLAQLQGSNLLQTILLSMQQSIAGKTVEGALGKPSDRVLYLAAHDTNIAHIASMLNLSWLVAGYQRDDSPPGGALVFRVWKRDSGYRVEVLFVSQTLEQMHTGAKLTEAAGPVVAPVFVPGCSEAGVRYECEWGKFQAAR